MAWPLISDFSKMLQTPKVAFRDPTVRECTIEMDQFGQPKARSGNFATVYRAYRPDGSEFAIRVFNRRSDTRRSRYQAVSEYLASHRAPCLVDFSYDEKGIRSASDGQMYPLLTMDWVPGVTLFEWARDRSREGYQEALALGAEAWLCLVRELATADIVHGDLQHGNVMVSSEGYFKLVDYDCMCVPELLGQRNVEIGLEPYQHPGRDAETLMTPELDHFSALVIYVALRALAAAPHLWTTYVDQLDYDRMLFRKDDFLSPGTSSLYHELCHSPDPQVRDLAHYLFELYRYDLQAVPTVDEVILWCHSVEELLGASDWDRATQLVERLSDAEPLAAELRPQIEEAYRRVAARQALQDAYDQGDEAELAARYDPELLDDYPAAVELATLASQAGQVRGLLETMQAQIRFSRWDLFRDTWQANQKLLAGRPSAQTLSQEYEKLLVAETLVRLAGDHNASDQKVLDAWRKLESFGGHPLGEPCRTRVEARLKRQQAAAQLRDLVKQAPAPATPAHDQQLIAAWRPKLFGSSIEFAALREHVMAARRRLKQLKRLGELTSECSLESEQAFANASQDLPTSYHPKLAPRINQAKARLAACAELREAIKVTKSDIQILKAWKQLEQATGLPILNEPQQTRIKLAKRRLAKLRTLRDLPDNLTHDQRNEQLLDRWDHALLDACEDARPLFIEVQEAEARQQALAELAQAMSNDDAREVKTLLAGKALASHPLPADIKQQVVAFQNQQQQAELTRRQAMLDALLTGNRAQFLQQFDTVLAADICEHAPHHQKLVSQWVEEDLMPLARLGLETVAENGLERHSEEENTWTIRWTWPSPRVCHRCELAVVEQLPPPDSEPAEIESHYSATIDRNAWEDAKQSHTLVYQEAWGPCLVVVWAVVDLGFQRFLSEPLELGSLGTGRKSRWGLFRSSEE